MKQEFHGDDTLLLDGDAHGDDILLLLAGDFQPMPDDDNTHWWSDRK